MLLPLDFAVHLQYFHNEILEADVCKIKMENNLKENWPKKVKINEVVKRGEIINNFKKLKRRKKWTT